jgi:hypothetical protein
LIQSTDFPPQLGEVLSQIVENESLSNRAKFQHVLKTISSFYASRTVTETTRRTGKTKDRPARQLRSFVEAIGAQLLYRTVKYAEVAANESVQAEILQALKELKSELLETLASNDKLQQSFPAEELVKLREQTVQQRRRLRTQKREIRELKSAAAVPRNEIDALKQEIANRERENQFYDQQLKTIRDSLHYQGYLKHTVSKLNAKTAALEAELHSKHENEKSEVQRRLTDLHNEKRIAQREMELLRPGSSDPLSDPMLEATALTGRLVSDDADSGAYGGGDLDRRLRRLEDENRRLQHQLNSERGKNIQQMKDAKLGALAEFQDYVGRLEQRCTQQETVITSLATDRTSSDPALAQLLNETEA